MVMNTEQREIIERFILNAAENREDESVPTWEDVVTEIIQSDLTDEQKVMTIGNLR